MYIMMELLVHIVARRSVSLVGECMEPVQKECAKYNKLSPTRQFTKVARCDQGQIRFPFAI